MITMTREPTEAVVTAARALAPSIQAERATIDRAGRLPQPLLEEFANAGLLRMYTPSAFGGPQVDPITFTRAVEEVARVDGSAGWGCSR